MTWKTYAPLIRTGGNFGVTFFSSLTTFNFITNLPNVDLIVGAALTAGVTTGLAISYEARKYQLGKK